MCQEGGLDLNLKQACDATVAFIEFVNSYLTKLSEKHGSRRKPYWSLDVKGKLTEGKLAITYWNEMLLTKDLLLAWLIDSREAEPIIRHVLAHEFGHYLHHVKHVRGGSFTRERLAKEFAEQESGMKDEECSKKLEELLRKASARRSLGLCHG